MSIRARATAIWTIARGPSLVHDSCSTVALGLIRIAERVLLAGALVTATSDLLRGTLLALVTAALHAMRSLLAVRLRVSRRVDIELRAASAILAADPAVPLAGTDLDLFATFHEGTELLVRLLVDLVPDACGDAAATLVLACFVVSQVPAVHFVAFGVLLLAAASGAFVARKYTASSAVRAWDANGPVWRQLRAVLGARQELVATGTARAAERGLAERLSRWALSERRYRLLAGFTGRLPWAVVGAGVTLAFLSARWSRLDADVLRECSLFAGIGAPLATLVAALHEATKSEPGISRLLLLAGAPPALEESCAAALVSPREVTARDIGFRYRGATRDALAGVKFVWRQGRVLGIGGVNGAGKSTLLRLLLRLDQPSAGSFAVDGAAWSRVSDASWRASVAYVAQAPYLDDEMPVRDFCRLLAPDASDAALGAALRRVDAWDRLLREPSPLDVPLRVLSVGMRQRVVLARALAQDRPILILDEPDASLDAHAVTQLAALLRELAADRLVAVVAHAPALLDAADDRVVLGNV